MSGSDTIKAIDDHQKAQRLAEVQRQQQAYQIRLMVKDGYGWEDLKRQLGVSRKVAREAVFGRAK